MSKIKNDKYYTSPELAEYIVDKTKEIIGEENITEYLESSAGNGVFLDYLPPNILAYDIEPEDNLNRIIKQDYLILDLEYKKGRCIIGNPPYGKTNNLAKQFFKKSIQIGDYISFIFPISQLHNNIELFDFDLVYSEDLNEKLYSNRKIHCCLNIYKRPNNGLNKKNNYKLKDVEVRDYRRNRISSHLRTFKNKFNYDIRICGFGASIGKETKYEGQYVRELCIKINNIKYKDEILKLIKNTKWTEIYHMTKSPNLTCWQVLKYIKEQIPEIE